MTLEEILKAQGLDDETVKGITENMTKNKIYISNEENIDIRYNKLKGEFENLTAEHEKSTDLIKELKESKADKETIQTKIGDYETQMQTLQTELEQTKKESAMKVALLSAGVKASDIDYLSYQMQKKGTELKLDNDGNIKGVDDIVSSLKVQFPSQFETASKKKIDEKKLDGTDPEKGLTKSDILKKPYQERLEFFNTNPDEFKEIMGK